MIPNEDNCNIGPVKLSNVSSAKLPAIDAAASNVVLSLKIAADAEDEVNSREINRAERKYLVQWHSCKDLPRDKPICVAEAIF